MKCRMTGTRAHALTEFGKLDGRQDCDVMHSCAVAPQSGATSRNLLKWNFHIKKFLKIRELRSLPAGTLPAVPVPLSLGYYTSAAAAAQSRLLPPQPGGHRTLKDLRHRICTFTPKKHDFWYDVMQTSLYTCVCTVAGNRDESSGAR